MKPLHDNSDNGWQAPPVEPATTTPPRWLTRLLDGDRAWGSIDVSPTRYGVTHYRLVVFPPGIERVERRLLRAWRAWPTWGVLLWFLALCLCSSLTPWARVALPTIIWLCAGAYLFSRVGPLRARVRTLCATRIAGHRDLPCAQAHAKIGALVAVLIAADAERERGHLSMAAHEAVWWQVYDQLGSDRTLSIDQNHCG